VIAYTFDWSVVGEYLPYLLRGVILTLEVSVMAQAVGVVFGFLLALARLSRWSIVRLLAIGYIDFMRGVPILALLLWVYYGFPILMGISMTAMQAAVVGLGASYAAFLAEIFRSGLQAVPKGQREAGQTLGMTGPQIMLRVIVPQAFRIVIPPFGNTFISMIKDSSLVSILAVDELTRRTQIVAAETFRPFELYAAAIVIYYLLTFVVARLVTLCERWLAPTSTSPSGPPLFRRRRAR
jgi:His/Glu/Gln/Arg/opine family amino acid ABC transporter permease subunit